MEQILQGIPFCYCILDDVLITGRDDSEHLQVLQQVFERLSINGLQLNKDKCFFLQDKVEYCGHIVTKNGVQQSPDNIAAIVNAPAPTNVSQLRSVLGMIMYYYDHLPNVSTVLHPLNKLLQKNQKWFWNEQCEPVLHPLNKLLQKNQKWFWNEQCEQAFNKVKQMIAAYTCLTHFDPSSTIILATDASAYGIGAVLSHRTFNYW